MTLRSHPSRFALAFLALAGLAPVSSGCVADVFTKSDSDSGGCDVAGEHYDVGDSFPADDGCNSCTCLEDGSAACTLMGCVDTCSYGGQTYYPGDSFPADDGCNTCECMEDGGVGCTEKGCLDGCDYGGQWYEIGQVFEAGDGCNTCECTLGGVSCTLADCAPTCSYGGQTYFAGDQFPALDGCNMCECLFDGGVSCTEKACSCDPAAEWYREYVSTDVNECMLIDFVCPENTVGFTNSCGCGCEQDASCPEWFDCMPPAQCDVEAMKLKCPYSGFAF